LNTHPLVELEVAVQPGPGPRVLLVAASEWSALLERGAPSLRPDDLAALRTLAAFQRFAARAGQSLPWSTADGACGLVVGRNGAGTAGWRTAAAAAASLVHEEKPWSLVVPSDGASGGDALAARLVAAAEGVLLSTYRFTRSSREEPAARPGRCTLVVGDVASGRAALDRARAHVAGVVLTRDLVNTPAGDLGPSELADAASDLARRHGFKAEVVRGDDVARRGFRMVAAVGRGSARAPTVTILTKDCDGRAPAVALVGKGVVFDSGGLDLKPSDAMLLMRKDMAGAATVLGALETASRLRTRVPLVALLPSAENMVGPDCYRPGDVLTAYDGTTVEIGNTDAEGRLLLADAIGHARSLASERIVDVATLTGAARTALGPDVPALFGNDDALVQLVEREAAAHDERMWRLPLVDEYDRQLDTPFADVNHVSHDRRAGAITAALFLRRFVRETPWAHVDLYAWEESGRPDCPKGANGMGVRTVAALLERIARSEARESPAR
jgi:leucyl aminopeptidase